MMASMATAVSGEFGCGTSAVTTGTGVQGNWVGTYGVDGYALAAWNGIGSTGDLVQLPNATLTMEQGTRFVWANPTTDQRGLKSPDGTQRRGATWYDGSAGAPSG